MKPVTHEADPNLIERSGDLKREVLEFALGRRFSRELRRATRERFGPVVAADEGEYGNFLDYFILQRRLPDGRTVVEHFVDRHPELPEAERAMLLGWRDVVEGVFAVERREGEALIAKNLIDELSYRVRSNMGPGVFSRTPAGSFLIARLVPVADEWLISGFISVLPASRRRDAYRLAAEMGLARPARVFRNPEKLEQGRTFDRREVAAFRQFFGSNVAVLPGRDLVARMNAYWRFRIHEFREEDGRTAAEKAAQRGVEVPAISEADLPAALLESEAVGVIYDEVDGLNYFPDFGLVEETFASPERAADPDHRQAVLTYLESPGIIPLPLRLLAERDPQRASRVFQQVLNRPRFSWERDGEQLLRRHKPEYYERPPLPTMIPLSDELSQASQATSDRPRRRGRGRRHRT